ncbi:MAG: acyl-CoA dehydrogenase family protein, partial [Hyphomicrobiales bacterium]|nr:acyl-CoA dehydrogenase family protein [Hyphomicrobiales bacterium]
MAALDIPRPDWMSEDLVILEDAAQKFFDHELMPHNERWLDAGIMDRDAWDKTGQAGLLCASMPEEYGGAGGTFAHEAVITRAIGLAGLDSFGA